MLKTSDSIWYRDTLKKFPRILLMLLHFSWPTLSLPFNYLPKNVLTALPLGQSLSIWCPEGEAIRASFAERQLLPKIAKFAKLIEFSSRQRHFLCYEIFYNCLLSMPKGEKERCRGRQRERERWQPHLTPGKRQKAKGKKATRNEAKNLSDLALLLLLLLLLPLPLPLPCCKINFQFDFK